MSEHECTAFLAWALPYLGLRPRGFSNVRRQVYRRVTARVRELGLDFTTYRTRVEEDDAERAVLDALCFVTISRFYRDAAVYDALRAEYLPRFAQDGTVRAWSAGCASGEEPYSLALAWHLDVADRFPAATLDVLATDFDEAVLVRAASASYGAMSLRELPEGWFERAFEPDGEGTFRVQARLRREVAFRRADIRTFTPEGSLHLVLCRNVAFTYFGEAFQLDFCRRVADSLVPGGVLVVGRGEKPPEHPNLLPTRHPLIWQRV